MRFRKVRRHFNCYASCFVAIITFSEFANAQSLGNAGTIEGTIVDQSGASIPRAQIKLTNAVSGYSQGVTSAEDGSFRLVNIPPNPYHLEVTTSGFDVFTQDVSIRNAIPIPVKVTLAVAGAQSAVTVEAGANALETNPSAHVDVDRSLFLKLPASDPGAGLSQAIVHSTGGVAADANGFFHPLGDRAQVSFVIDGQPISDQQSKLYSTQLPTSAIQSMEATTGTPSAEFGDKSSLVAQITTRSGLGIGRVFGNVDATYVVVQRNVGGLTLQYIERMADRFPVSYKDTSIWCVDSGLQYNGAAATVFGGLFHLVGMTVTGLADGNVIPPTVVAADGSVTLSQAASVVTIGLSYTPQLQTLPLDLGEPTVQGKRKKITAVTVRCSQTLSLSIGSSFTTLVPMKDSIIGNVGSATNAIVTDLVTADARTVLDPTYTVPGQYCIQQSSPLPVSVLGVIPEVVVGDTPK